jgi:uncharacterized protein
MAGPSSYLLPGLEGNTSSSGENRVIALEPIHTGRLIIVFGGDVISRDALVDLSPSNRRLCLQVEEDLYILSTSDGPAEWVNHSCDPNAGMQGQIALVAMRDIAAGEEICMDYAMTDGSPYDEFECRCGKPNCRGRITGDDWRRPELWPRYAGYFSPYLQRRIAELVIAKASTS